MFCLGGERIDHAKHAAHGGGGVWEYAPKKCLKFRPSEVASGAPEGL